MSLHQVVARLKLTRLGRLVVDRLAAAPGAWVPLPELIEITDSICIRGQVYLARKLLKAVGYTIENRKERHGRATHSWYRLVKLEAECAATTTNP